jgi:type IV secretory pathway VirB10-like protein
MNGRPPSLPQPPPNMQPPPSVQRARQRPASTGRRAWSGFSRGRILAGLLALVVIALVAIKVYLYTEQQQNTKDPNKNSTASLEPYWAKQTFNYKKQEPLLPVTAEAPPDLITPELIKLRAELAANRNEMRGMKGEIEELRNRKTTTTVIQQGAQQAAQQTTTQTPKASIIPTPLLYGSHDLSKEELAPQPKVDEYTLAPGTFLPCQVETVINSDVEGYFTAKVHSNVYDTKTGQWLLVPQGSTIVGNDQSKSLVYGNERMDTVSLTLSLPDGRHVDLGRAPVTDQQGVAGLTGDVDQHYWRLFGAVFIGGALKGGATAMQTAMTSASGAGQVTSGIATLGNQATSNVVGPMLNTRPTIIVHAQQLCNVLLVNELSLPAMWQGTPTVTRVVQKPSTPRR